MGLWSWMFGGKRGKVNSECDGYEDQTVDAVDSVDDRPPFLIAEDIVSVDLAGRDDNTSLPARVTRQWPSLDRHDYPDGRHERFGPFDSRALTDDYFDELDEPASVHVPRHSRAPWLDLPVHVWAQNLFFFAPHRVTVYDIGTDRDDGSRDVTGLLLEVPACGPRPGFSLVVTAFAAPVSGGLWADVGWRSAWHELDDGWARIRAWRGGPWGVTVGAVADAQDVYVLGVDGKRWMVRVTAYGPVVDESVRATVHEMVSSMVVHRDHQPLGPGTPLDLSLLDRRQGRRALAEPVADSSADELSIVDSGELLSMSAAR